MGGCPEPGVDVLEVRNCGFVGSRKQADRLAMLMRGISGSHELEGGVVRSRESIWTVLFRRSIHVNDLDAGPLLECLDALPSGDIRGTARGAAERDLPLQLCSRPVRSCRRLKRSG